MFCCYLLNLFFATLISIATIATAIIAMKNHGIYGFHRFIIGNSISSHKFIVFTSYHLILFVHLLIRVCNLQICCILCRVLLNPLLIILLVHFQYAHILVGIYLVLLLYIFVLNRYLLLMLLFVLYKSFLHLLCCYFNNSEIEY